MTTTLINMNPHPVAVKITRPGAATGTQVDDYVTLMPRGKATLAEGQEVHANWAAVSTGVQINRSVEGGA